MDEILTHVTEGDLVGWPGFELDTTTNSFVSMIWQAGKRYRKRANHWNIFVQSLARTRSSTCLTFKIGTTLGF